jgi:putative endonuclease
VTFVYILRCCDGTYYTGVAKDVTARVKQHSEGKGARYTRGRRPVVLAWSKECASWSEGLKEEIRIKRLDRVEKERIVNGANG